MTLKRALFATACGSLFLTLTACPPSLDDSNSNFFVQSSGARAGYTPQGSGWKPNTKVEISIWGEPDGAGGASTEWRHLFDEQVDGIGMFGYNGGAQFLPVARKFCGNPEQGQVVTFMAKSQTGRIQTYRPGADIYFTFQPCPH
jgi:hypothetical protein